MIKPRNFLEACVGAAALAVAVLILTGAVCMLHAELSR